jgi:hypothetical protein
MLYLLPILPQDCVDADEGHLAINLERDVKMSRRSGRAVPLG